MKKGMEFWMAHVAAVKLEAISASAYARRHEISVTALYYYWQHKLKSKAEVSERQKIKFLALHIAAQSPYLYTLVLPSGLHLEKKKDKPPCLLP